MGKRSNFERVSRDFYPTPYEAVIPLMKHLPRIFYYVEPCAGDGCLVDHIYKLTYEGAYCNHMSDIEPRQDLMPKLDALNLSKQDVQKSDYIITNPPWDRKILHPMINHFRQLKPTWLLFDADWMHTKQSSEYIKFCSKIVSVGRVKWIPDSKMTGKDNCCWYLFEKEEQQTIFYGR